MLAFARLNEPCQVYKLFVCQKSWKLKLDIRITVIITYDNDIYKLMCKILPITGNFWYSSI